MADRWVLHRAGITNVYQYGDEVLRFGGGRLLLRGVNGSGKSTAMNMLLPFLLEADTRRIDAAGEQSGVLRSWMLSGRDEQQPVGYLWIEFRRGDRYLTLRLRHPGQPVDRPGHHLVVRDRPPPGHRPGPRRRPAPGSPLARLVHDTSALGLPVHLTQRARGSGHAMPGRPSCASGKRPRA